MAKLTALILRKTTSSYILGAHVGGWHSRSALIIRPHEAKALSLADRVIAHSTLHLIILIHFLASLSPNWTHLEAFGSS